MARRLVQTHANVEFFPLLIAIGIACAIALLSIRDWAAYGKWRTEAQRHDEIVNHADALLSLMKDAETGQRGYLLTGNDSYLSPYLKAVSRVPRQFEALRKTATPNERGNVNALRSVIGRKMAELQQTVDLRKTQGLPAALRIVQSNLGQILMEQIRTDLSGIVQREEQAQQRAQTRLESSMSGLRLVSIIGSLVLAALLLAAQLALGEANAKRLRLIADLRSSRDEVSNARDLLQTTLQSIGDAVIATDEEGRVRFINPVAQHLTGWTQQSAIGVSLHRVFRIVNEATRESVENPVEKVIRTGRVVGLANHTILLTPDGRETPIDDSAAPIRATNGSILGTVLVFRDVTERRRSELQLRKGQSELERSNAALQQLNSDLELFAYAAGHDMQEPLRTIAAFSELVARKLEGNSQTVQHIRFIQHAVTRMRAMIDGLLSYSQLMAQEASLPVDVRMEEVVGEVLLNLETSIAETHAVVETEPLPMVSGNRQQLVHLFQNLISNAIKYRSEQPPRIHISAATSNGGAWLFAVRDNGMGFDMQHSDLIFQVFRRLHSSDHIPGTGLGLAMSKRIVELHGGRIWVESEPNCGSIFRFTIAKQESLNGA